MSLPVYLYGGLAAHRRGKVLQEVLSAGTAKELPEGRAVVLEFAQGFQTAEPEVQGRLIEWTREPGHLLLLLPPFAAAPSDRPVSWRAERLGAPPRGGEGLAELLAPEVAYRLTGKLQTPAVPGATWSDLSIGIATHRVHPAAGLFAVTCLPIWSLTVLDAPKELESWLALLAALAGEVQEKAAAAPPPLEPDHYGLLVFLLSREFSTEEEALTQLDISPLFRFVPDRARWLLDDLRARGLIQGPAPTTEAEELVMASPYALYVRALREVSP